MLSSPAFSTPFCHPRAGPLIAPRSAGFCGTVAIQGAPQGVLPRHSAAWLPALARHVCPTAVPRPFMAETTICRGMLWHGCCSTAILPCELLSSAVPRPFMAGHRDMLWHSVACLLHRTPVMLPQVIYLRRLPGMPSPIARTGRRARKGARTWRPIRSGGIQQAWRTRQARQPPRRHACAQLLRRLSRTRRLSPTRRGGRCAMPRCGWPRPPCHW